MSKQNYKSNNGKKPNNKDRRDYRNQKPDPKSKECNDNTKEKSNHRAAAKLEYPGQDNEVQWYKGSKEHAIIVERSAQAANFETIAGRPISATLLDKDYCTPAICVFRMVTGPGISDANESQPSPSTLASRKSWSVMRTVLTNASRYQPADVSMLLCAMDEVLSLAVHINRMFRIVNTYKINNIYFPDEFLRALYDFDAKDIEYLRSNKLNLIADYNQACIACAPLTIPNEYGFIRRHTFLYANIFADGKTAKSQFFCMKPYGYRLWHDTVDSQGSSLNFRRMYQDKPENVPKAKWLIKVMWDMINAITGSESALEILGDVWKVFGKGTAFAPMPASEFDFVDVVYDNYVVLGQINNAYTLGLPLTAIDENHAYDIRQDVATNSLVFNPSCVTNDVKLEAQMTLLSTNSTKNNRMLLNAHLENPSPDDVIELTRMIPTVKENILSAEPYYLISSMGCDFVDSFQIYGVNGPAKDPLLFAYNFINLADANLDTQLSALAAFDWHPPMFITDGIPTMVSQITFKPLMDIDNYAVVDIEQVRQLNDNIQMAMWNIGDLNV